MLNDLIQQPVCHGVEICKRVSLGGGWGNSREKHGSQRTSNHLRALSENVTVRVINLIPIRHHLQMYLVPLRHEEVQPGSWQS